MNLKPERSLKTISTLTSIRFIAAFYVFLFHIAIRWQLPANNFAERVIDDILGQGAVAMSLFFILSGFILTYNYYSMDPFTNYRDFIIKRFARIYPVYALAMILYIPWFGVQEPHLALKSIFLIFTNLFFLQAWFPALFYLWNDGGSWSLSVEFFCYFLFPFILFWLLKHSNKKLFICLIVAYLFTILPGLSVYLFDPKPLMPTIYAMPIYRLPEFVVGMITCLFFLRFNHAVTFLQTKLIAIFLIVCIWLGLIGSKLPYYIGHNIIIIPAFALAIYLIAGLQKGFIYKIFKHRIAIFLGEISFSFYLLQALFMEIFKKDYDQLIQAVPFLKHFFIFTILIFTTVLLASIFSYLFVEKPFRRWIINNFILKKTQKTFSLSQDPTH